MPMITILGLSGDWGVRESQVQKLSATRKEIHPPIDGIRNTDRLQIIRNLAISQLILMAYTVTSGHVQIITRISSSCPVYLWYTAALIGEGQGPTFEIVGRFMVIYAGIQSGLFASFLPPA